MPTMFARNGFRICVIALLMSFAAACSSDGSSCIQGEAPCGPICCGAGFACIGGACCPPVLRCGGMCCSAHQTCVTQPNGAQACFQSCTRGSNCASGCCAPFPADNASVCMPNDGTHACLCGTGADCATHACAPLVDDRGDPVGPYVCKPNDGAPYDGCGASGTACSGNSCCVLDDHGNAFCATPCAFTSECRHARCGGYDFSRSTCPGPTACGP